MRLFIAFFTFAISLGTLAQDTYPAKTVRVIAPAGPGGNPDVLGRSPSSLRLRRRSPGRSATARRAPARSTT